MNRWSDPESYEEYIGRWSRATAAEFLAWLHVRRGARWLDVSCGTGEVTRAILEHNAPESVTGVDFSAPYVTYAREKTTDPRATFEVGDAHALPGDENAYDAAVAGLSINMLTDQPRAVAEMMRVVRPGGVVGAYVWDFDGEMQMLRRFWDAVEALDPRSEESAPDPRFAICSPEPFANLFRGAGLDDVEVRAIDTLTVFKNFDDYWKPFLSGEAPAQKHTAALSEARRVQLRESLRANLPVTGKGSIPLIARAWAVKGRVPR